MVKEGDSARKKAAECMALAAKASVEEHSNILRAMARSWMTLANQMDRLEAANDTGTGFKIPTSAKVSTGSLSS